MSRLTLSVSGGLRAGDVFTIDNEDAPHDIKNSMFQFIRADGDILVGRKLSLDAIRHYRAIQFSNKAVKRQWPR
jgi:hypothetical protein